jgi:hypothetical protein
MMEEIGLGTVSSRDGGGVVERIRNAADERYATTLAGGLSSDEEKTVDRLLAAADETAGELPRWVGVFDMLTGRIAELIQHTSEVDGPALLSIRTVVRSWMREQGLDKVLQELEEG